MASSSTSPVHKNFKYDVFLSFRGEDTRKSFIDHLYYALQQKSIHTYKDDERIEKGKRISDELIKSIHDSRFHIIVFSKNYASSTWCLEELVQIMECHKTVEQTAYPIFYDVEPSEVRKQSGEFGQVFAKHEKKKSAGKWRETLEEAASLAGWELKNTLDGHEAKFIQRIVEKISLELRSINFNVDGKLIGMDTRIKDVVSSLETGFDDVHVMGIKGMGGGGKTTLARAVFDQISIQFEGKSFVENVREVSTSSLSGLKKLQKQILQHVLNDQDIKISNVHEGKKMMKKMMCCRKVLVVLDDVDHLDQLEALAGEINWFKQGSVIIITTRDEQVLIAHKVNFIHDVNLLSQEEASCLLSRYAFGREIPMQGYEELLKQVVRYAAGLPLTIRVLGSFLCGKNEHEWIDTLERLKEIPLKETLDKLELSYIGLEEDYKEIFLDVACILKGWWKEEAIKVLESCGFHARNGLRVLEQKSLITIFYNEYNGEFLGMHDHIEEMGKNIVRRMHPDKPKRHSRLWIEEEIKDVLANDLDTNEAIRCIKLQMRELNPEIITNGLGYLNRLRFLHVSSQNTDDIFDSSWKFDEVGQYFPNALRYLSWGNFPFWSFPKTFQANNLVTLQLRHSKIVQLWEGGQRKVLNKLRFLDLSYSMLNTLDLGLTPNLETLTLDHCENLVEIHIPLVCLKLISLDVTFSKLRNLDLTLTPNLETLELVDCADLIEIHMPFKCPKLIFLDLYHSKLSTLNLGQIPNLEKLSLGRCLDLVELQMPVECLNLISLDVSHSKLRTLDLGKTPNLQRLNLRNCYRLVEFRVPVGGLKNLTSLCLSGCFGFTEFDFTKELECVFRYLDQFHPFSELNLSAEFLDICPLHSYDCSLSKFQFTCFFEELVLSSLGNLENVSIGLGACRNGMSLSKRICGLQCVSKLKLGGSIQEAPKDLYKLKCLEQLKLSFTKIKHLPDNICMLKHLKILTLKECELLEKLPEDLGRLECLEVLWLLKCINLRDIPNSICKMTHLECLNLNGCILVENLPEELGSIECLQELDIEGTGIRHLPLSIVLLEGLHIKGSTLLHQSCISEFGRRYSFYDTFYHRGTHSKSLLHDPDF